MNAFDFDDLLVKGLELFTKHWRVLANLRCVLVDEFQDTNHVQYELFVIFIHLILACLMVLAHAALQAQKVCQASRAYHSR